MEIRLNLAILQARMSSTRLPNKVLKEVNGVPLLKYECERILQSQKIDKLIIATSTDKSDDTIENFVKENGIDIFRGSLDDVLSRYYKCAKEFKEANGIDNLNIIRVTGDCPIIDPQVIDELIEYFEENDCDYASNTLVPTYPDGMDIEICTFEALEIAYNEASFKSDREHVTLFIKNEKRFKKLNYTSKYDFSHLRMTVDEENDFELIKTILENLYKNNSNFSYLDAISFMTKNPDTLFINSNITRDEGLAKSLKEDGRL
jgi:spore coat polysaccharide biosynthesis protein SpsF (cytidylyltransferase family)